MAITAAQPSTSTRWRRRFNGRLLRNIVSVQPRLTLLIIVLCVLIGTWLDVILSTERARFVVLAPTAKLGIELLLALTSLAGALVLLLFPAGADRGRLRWVAAGFLVLGGGGLGFGYLAPLRDPTPELQPFMYASLLIQSIAGVCWCVGFWPTVAPRLRGTRWLAVSLATATAVLFIYASGRQLPHLVRAQRLEDIALRDRATLGGLTGWYWLLALVPLALMWAAALGAMRRRAEPGMHSWLVVAMTLAAGAQLHALFWPTAFSPILTTSSLLRLTFTLVVAVGSIVSLRNFAVERSRLLSTAESVAKQAGAAARAKADFTAMIAHELSSPLAAIRRQLDLLADAPDAAASQTALAAMHAQLDGLQRLVGDAQTVATIERDEFAIFPRPIRLRPLLERAASGVAGSLGDRAVRLDMDGPERVLADAQRIEQVLHNLLGNAAKYAPAGTLIELTARQLHGRASIAVIDHGRGIHPDDLTRVFDKFERGREHSAAQTPGAGLGLYLSRQIVRAHGAELEVNATPGGGATFSFWLDPA
jgi:signal transduction histidine kinase